MIQTEIEILQSARDISQMTKSEALAELQVYCKFKIWSGRYFALDQRVQTLATRDWVREDVFGHTFTGQS